MLCLFSWYLPCMHQQGPTKDLHQMACTGLELAASTALPAQASSPSSLQPSNADLAAENAALQEALVNLRSDFERVCKDVEAIKQRLFMSDAPLFGSGPPPASGLDVNGGPPLANGLHTSHKPAELPQTSSHASKPRLQPHFGGNGLQFGVLGGHDEEGIVVVGGHDGKWLSTCSTYFPGTANPGVQGCFSS